jgi:hypothetical protein
MTYAVRMVIFMPLPLYPGGKIRFYPLNRSHSTCLGDILFNDAVNYSDSVVPIGIMGMSNDFKGHGLKGLCLI